MVRRPRALTGTEAAEWAKFAHRVSPLPGRPVLPPPEVPLPGIEASSIVTRTASVTSKIPARSGPLGIGGQPAGVDTGTWQRFHKGQIGGVRKLDLHGMTAQHAFHVLRSFLRAAHADRVRCVEIVTGRGNPDRGGVLRRELPIWLNLPDIRPMVLAAAHPSASNAMHSHMINTGSVRLLLRRPRS